MIAELIVKHGEVVIFNDVEDENGRHRSLNVAQFVDHNLRADGLSLSNSLYARILDEAVAHSDDAAWKAEPYFVNHDDIEVSRFAVPLTDVGNLNPAPEARDSEEMRQHTMHLVLDFRVDYLDRRLRDIKKEIASAGQDGGRLRDLMEEFKDKSELRNRLARMIGSNILV